MQAYLPTSLLPRLEPNRASIFLYQVLPSTSLERLLPLCYGCRMQEYYRRYGLGIFPCFRIRCVVNIIITVVTWSIQQQNTSTLTGLDDVGCNESDME